MSEVNMPKPLYDRIERWLIDFYVKAATNFNGTPQYYADAASGLSIALQEIDRGRYDKTSAAIWDDYQKLKAEHPKGDTELCFAGLSDEDMDRLRRILQKLEPGPLQPDEDMDRLRRILQKLEPGPLQRRVQQIRCYCSRCNKVILWPVGGVLADG